MADSISRQAAIDAVSHMCSEDENGITVSRANVNSMLQYLPSVQSEPREVVPHRNYQYLSDYWCECGWHLGKKGDVKYCPDCGRKVIWDG